jgi:hypothetical protein
VQVALIEVVAGQSRFQHRGLPFASMTYENPDVDPADAVLAT